MKTKISARVVIRLNSEDLRAVELVYATYLGGLEEKVISYCDKAVGDFFKGCSFQRTNCTVTNTSAIVVYKVEQDNVTLNH